MKKIIAALAATTMLVSATSASAVTVFKDPNGTTYMDVLAFQAEHGYTRAPKAGPGKSVIRMNGRNGAWMFGNLLPEGQALPYVNDLESLQEAAKDNGTILVASADKQFIIPIPGIVAETARQSGIDAFELMSMMSGMDDVSWEEHARTATQRIVAFAMNNGLVADATAGVRSALTDAMIKELVEAARKGDLAEITRLNDVIDDLKDDATANEMAFTIAKAELESQIADLKSQISDLKSDLETAPAAYVNEMIATMNPFLDALGYQLVYNEISDTIWVDLHDTHNIYLKSYVQNLVAEVNKLKHGIVQANASNAALSAQLTVLEENCAEVEAQLATANTNLAAAATQIANLQDMYDTMRATATGLQASLDTANAEIESLNAEVATKNSTIDTLESTISSLEDTNSSLNGQLDNMQSQIDDLEDEILVIDNTDYDTEDDAFIAGKSVGYTQGNVDTTAAIDAAVATANTGLNQLGLEIQFWPEYGVFWVETLDTHNVFLQSYVDGLVEDSAALTQLKNAFDFTHTSTTVADINSVTPGQGITGQEKGDIVVYTQTGAVNMSKTFVWTGSEWNQADVTEKSANNSVHVDFNSSGIDSVKYIYLDGANSNTNIGARSTYSNRVTYSFAPAGGGAWTNYNIWTGSSTLQSEINNAIVAAMESAFRTGYDEGYDDGYADGYDDGFADGVASKN